MIQAARVRGRPPSPEERCDRRSGPARLRSDGGFIDTALVLVIGELTHERQRETCSGFTDYKVADLSLAGWGRKEIAIAETEMPGADGDPRGVREDPAAEGRAHHRLAAHDDPDRRADRDAEGARRGRALGLLQHLLDPGPRRRRHRRGRHAGVRLQGRVAGGVLGLHPPHLRVRPTAGVRT